MAAKRFPMWTHFGHHLVSLHNQCELHDDIVVGNNQLLILVALLLVPTKNKEDKGNIPFYEVCACKCV